MGAIVGWTGPVEREQWPTIHHVLRELIAASAAATGLTTGFAALRPGGSLTREGRQASGSRFVVTSRTWGRLGPSCCVIAHCGVAGHGKPDVRRVQRVPPAVNARDGLAVIIDSVVPELCQWVRDRVGGPLCRTESDAALRMAGKASHPADGLCDILNQFGSQTSAVLLDAGNRTLWYSSCVAQPLWMLELVGIDGCFLAPSRDVVRQAFLSVSRSRPDLHIRALAPLAPGRIYCLESLDP
jgi:hypothetical protein